MKILIAESHTRMREFIKLLVDKLGYTSIEASNGLMAIDNFIFHQPDIVIMDFKLKVIDGLEAVSIIKKMSATVKIIVVADYDDESLKQKAILAGADKYLLKENLIELKDFLNGS